MKGAGMLVVSFRGINLSFSSRLGCSGQNTIIFSRKGVFQFVLFTPVHVIKV